MRLTPYQIDVMNAKTCPYCKSETKAVSEKEIYGRTYQGRTIIVCSNYPKCDAYVGTHKNGEPLGRLANKALRQAKIEAHKHFDKLWKEEVFELEKGVARVEAYEMLSEYLDLPEEHTHIGMFNVKTCKKVTEWAKSKVSILLLILSLSTFTIFTSCSTDDNATLEKEIEKDEPDFEKDGVLEKMIIGEWQGTIYHAIVTYEFSENMTYTLYIGDENKKIEYTHGEYKVRKPTDDKDATLLLFPHDDKTEELIITDYFDGIAEVDHIKYNSSWMQLYIEKVE